MKFALSLGIGLLCLDVATASAQHHVRTPEQFVAPFWREVEAPGSVRAEALLNEARGMLSRTQGISLGEWENTCRALRSSSSFFGEILREWVSRSVVLENAEARLRRAQELSPHDPRIAFLLAWTVESWTRPHRDCSSERRDSDAIALFVRVRELDESYRAEDVAFELGILHSRLGHASEAIAEYQRRLALALSEDDTSSVHGNLAEELMQNGELSLAVEHYEAAVRIAERRGNATAELSLARWGLAVALDRLGEFSASLATARRAMEVDSNTMAVLRSRGVFFVPSYELHYIEAIGQLARRDGALPALPSAPARPGGNEQVMQQLEILLARPLSESSLQRVTAAASTLLAAPSATARTEASSALIAAVRESQFDREASPEMREAQRRIACAVAAARSFLRYLNEGGNTGRWARNATHHLAQLAAELAPPRRR